MSIIYDALEKTQRNLSNKRKLRFFYFQKSSIRIAIFLLLFVMFLLIFVLARHDFNKHIKHPVHAKLTAVSSHPVIHNNHSTVPVMVEPTATAVLPLVVQNTGRDPFQYAEPSHLTATLPTTNLGDLNGKFILNGVFISDNEKIALINNQPYHEGETIQGLKIVSIAMDSVKLADDKNSFVLHSAG